MEAFNKKAFDKETLRCNQQFNSGLLTKTGRKRIIKAYRALPIKGQ